MPSGLFLQKGSSCSRTSRHQTEAEKQETTQVGEEQNEQQLSTIKVQAKKMQTPTT